jgi:hypothetical protein
MEMSKEERERMIASAGKGPHIPPDIQPVFLPVNRGPYELQPDGTYRDPARPDEWRLSVEMIKLLHEAGWRQVDLADAERTTG